jgi:hypothetical protein
MPRRANDSPSARVARAAAEAAPAMMAYWNSDLRAAGPLEPGGLGGPDRGEKRPWPTRSIARPPPVLTIVVGESNPIAPSQSALGASNTLRP